MASSPRSADAEVAKLRYGFQADRQYTYEIKVHAKILDRDRNCDGDLVYKVLSATEQQAVLKTSGTAASRVAMNLGRGSGFPRRFGPPRFGPVGPEGITINRQGTVIVSAELTRLPFMLGDLELLVIEEFPQEAKSAWERRRDVVIEETEWSSVFPGMRFGPHTEKKSQHTANELIKYAIVEARADGVRVGRQYSLRSEKTEDNTVRFDMSGSGEFEFDPKAGVMRNLAMKYEVLFNETNLTMKVPISLACRLLTPEEFAERQKREREAAEKAKAEMAKANEPKPFQTGERAKLLRDLQSRDPGRQRAAADRLAKAVRDDQADDFARALAPLLSNPNDWVKGAAAKALIIWATPEAQTALVQASVGENFRVRRAAVEALGQVKTEKAAEAAAAQMFRNRGEAAKALKTMGPVAEVATIACLKDRDGGVRQEACRVLAEIGSEKGLKAMKEYAERVSGFELRDVDQAIDALEQRLAKADSASADSEKNGKNGSAQLRTWRDATGVFEIEATFLDYRDQNVTLQKKDGRTIRILLERLSTEDQDYVGRHVKADNPAVKK